MAVIPTAIWVRLTQPLPRRYVLRWIWTRERNSIFRLVSLTKWRKYYFLYSKKYSPKIHWDDLTSVNSHSFIATDKGCYLKQRRVPLRHAQSRLCDGESAGLVAGPSLQLNGTQPSLTFFYYLQKVINDKLTYCPSRTLGAILAVEKTSASHVRVRQYERERRPPLYLQRCSTLSVLALHVRLPRNFETIIGIIIMFHHYAQAEIRKKKPLLKFRIQNSYCLPGLDASRESMSTATKHQHFRRISILRAETTTVYLNSEEGESYVCDLAGDWPHFKRYAASFMPAHEHLEEAATRSRRCPRQPARKPRLRTLWQHRWEEGD